MADTDNKEKSNLQPSRRSFLNTIWAALGILAALELIFMVFTYLGRKKPGAQKEQSERLIDAGIIDKYPVGSVTANIMGKFYLCRMEDGGFIALSSKCTHLGCTVPWDDKGKRFICPCHGSSFDISGAVISSPAPRPLDMYPVHIENNTIIVDTGKLLKRNEFLKTQLVYTKKVSK
ncbi:MAG: ubiquinol-cytochrome c reductase iron-sulfur subunit [Deltaproteobacteria bacterium]|nr:ubiquinol-cytochrome c reductase iron-sulfur subunit [Deltaproteobacteria bacterium]